MRYIKTIDHKEIGMMYIVIALIAGITGMGYSLVIRSELMSDSTLLVNGQTINVLVTIHGIIMLIYVAMAVVLGGIGNMLVPMMIGASDMAIPRMNNLAIWILVMGYVLLLVSGCIEEGPGIGWTLYTPLSNSKIHSSVAVDAIIISIHLAGISSIMGSINLIVTILNMRCGGLTLYKSGLIVWATLITAILVIVAIPVLAATVTMLLSDRNLNTSIIESGGGGDSILIAHLIWIIGHPEVYILILPGIGIVSEVLRGISNKEIIGKVGMIWAMVSIAVIGNLVWAHHMITVGLDVRTSVYITVATMIIGVPTGIKVISWLGTIYGTITTSKVTVSELIVRGILILIVLGGVTGIILANKGVNVSLHDGYIIVGHIHIVLSIGLMITVIAGVYYWYKDILGVRYSDKWGVVHIWLIILGVNLTIIPMHILGYNGMPRRYANYMDALTGWNLLVTIGSIVSICSVIAILIGLINSIVNPSNEGDYSNIRIIISNNTVVSSVSSISTGIDKLSLKGVISRVTR